MPLPSASGRSSEGTPSRDLADADLPKDSHAETPRPEACFLCMYAKDPAHGCDPRLLQSASVVCVGAGGGMAWSGGGGGGGALSWTSGVSVSGGSVLSFQIGAGGSCGSCFGGVVPPGQGWGGPHNHGTKGGDSFVSLSGQYLLYAGGGGGGKAPPNYAGGTAGQPASLPNATGYAGGVGGNYNGGCCCGGGAGGYSGKGGAGGTPAQAGLVVDGDGDAQMGGGVVLWGGGRSFHLRRVSSELSVGRCATAGACRSARARSPHCEGVRAATNSAAGAEELHSGSDARILAWILHAATHHRTAHRH